MAWAMASPLRVKNTAYFDIAAAPLPTDTGSCMARLLEAMRPPLDRQASRARCWLPRSRSARIDGSRTRTRVTQRVVGQRGRPVQGEPASGVAAGKGRRQGLQAASMGSPQADQDTPYHVVVDGWDRGLCPLLH